MRYNGMRVGETGFYQHDGLTGRVARVVKEAGFSGVPLIYLKDEADNASGGHKARIVAHAMEIWSNQTDPVILTRATEHGKTNNHGRKELVCYPYLFGLRGQRGQRP